MLRYEKLAYATISVDLHNDYSVIALINWEQENAKYHVSLYLKRNDINMLDLIEKAEDIIFDSNMKSIKLDVTKRITELLSSGFFDYYVRRYEYEQKCFDRGNDLFEQERLNRVVGNK